MSPEFERKLEKEIDVIFREVRDGCNECRATNGICDKHQDKLGDVVEHPRKYVGKTAPEIMEMMR